MLFPEDYPCEYLNGQLSANGDVDGWKFNLYIPNLKNYSLHWDFGDGAVLDGNYYDNNLVTHDYDDNEYEDFYFNVCVTITDNENNCEKTICRHINTGCGIRLPDPHEQKQYKPKEKLKYYLIFDYGWPFWGGI